MAGFCDFRFQLPGARNGGINIFDLEPKQNTISVRFQARVANRTVMVLNVPMMKLKDESAVETNRSYSRPP